MIDRDHLAAYLHDHLAGAVTVIDLLEHRLNAQAEQELQALLDEIRAERRLLEQLLEQMDLSPGTIKQLAGWIAEKASRVKRDLDRIRGSAMSGLLELEILQVGISGKRALWTLLGELADIEPAVADLPLDDLIRQADEQRALVERHRLVEGRRALLT